VDEYGASVTIRGKSQVPFDGSIVVTARNRVTNNKQSYRQQLEDILTSGKESTAGIVWKGIPPGNYDILIEAVNQENITMDKYETVLRIPEYPAANLTAPNKSTPGFEGIVILIIIIAVSRRIKGV
jgi:predicted phage tail protein